MGRILGIDDKEDVGEYATITSETIEQVADEVATRILENDIFDFHVVDEYSTTSTGYLDSFHIGEYEDQIEVNRIREQLEDKLAGDFYNVLEDWIEHQRDYCIRTWGSTHLRDQKYPTVYVIVNTGLRVDYVIDDDALEMVVKEVLEAQKGGVA
jgi:hypothetical protein